MLLFFQVCAASTCQLYSLVELAADQLRPHHSFGFENKGDAARSSKRAALPNRPDFRVTCAHDAPPPQTAERAAHIGTHFRSSESAINLCARKRARKNWSVTLPST